MVFQYIKDYAYLANYKYCLRVILDALTNGKMCSCIGDNASLGDVHVKPPLGYDPLDTLADTCPCCWLREVKDD